MITIYAVRHGETTFNAEGRVQGTIDTPLTKFGREQAEAAAIYFAEAEITHIITSPLVRALDTAKAISRQHKIELKIEEDFREVSCGIFEGKTIDEIKKSNWGEWRKFLENPDHLPKDAESMKMLSARVEQAMQKTLAHSGPDDTIIIVCHAGVVRMVMAYLMNVSIETAVNFGLSNASIAKFINMHDRWTCLKWNSTEHLGELKDKVKFVL